MPNTCFRPFGISPGIRLLYNKTYGGGKVRFINSQMVFGALKLGIVPDIQTCSSGGWKIRNMWEKCCQMGAYLNLLTCNLTALIR